MFKGNMIKLIKSYYMIYTVGFRTILPPRVDKKLVPICSLPLESLGISSYEFSDASEFSEFSVSIFEFRSGHTSA